MQRVTRRRGWANVAAAGRGTKPYSGWSLGAMNSFDVGQVGNVDWIPRIVSVWAISTQRHGR